MCGISGIIDLEDSTKIELSVLQEMAKYLNQRGPDQDGFEMYTSNGFSFGLAHKRLSILDVSESSKQPMWDKSKSHVIVFNGEIYNYIEIRNELQQLGHHFQSTGDTEVMLCAYQQWGIDETLKRLEGMFAFCLVDKKSRKVFLARDRFGEKPLYYHINQKGFIAFGSDIRSFKSLPINLTINQVALGYYFSEMSTPKNASIYNEIMKLRANSKTVYASMGTVAASGGYYIACAADYILANPGTLTGSISAVMAFNNIEELTKKVGVKPNVIKSGKFKDVGSPLRSMTPEEQKLLQDVVDDVHEQFVQAIAKGRNMPPSEIHKIADGRIMTGQQALKLKLIDEVGGLEKTIELLAKKIGVTGRPKLIEQKEKTDFLDWFLQGSLSSGLAETLAPSPHPRLQYLWFP